MRKQNQSNALVPRPDGRPNTSVALHRKHKRPNAQKHGVFAEPLILPGEDPREFEALHAALIEEWTPSGPSEQSRVFGIADAEWRKLRSRRFAQAKAIGNSLRPDHPAFDEARGLITFCYRLCREPETAFAEHASKYLRADKIQYLNQKFPRSNFESIEDWAVIDRSYRCLTFVEAPVSWFLSQRVPFSTARSSRRGAPVDQGHHQGNFWRE